MEKYTSTQAGVYALVCALISATTGGYGLFEVLSASLFKPVPTSTGLALGISIFFGLMTIALFFEYAVLRMKDM